MSDTLLYQGLNFYQNANAEPEKIKANFLVRLHEYELIIEDLLRNPMKGSVQHYLILGRRGSGKSTLLKRLQVEIDTNRELGQMYISINLAEEQANIYRLFDLLEGILQELSSRNIAFEQPEENSETHFYTRNLFAAIHTAIERSGKKLVLLLDNIDRIFENLHEDAALLREYLLNYNDIKIIGGSTRLSEHFWKYDEPFYEFFRVLELKPLTSIEIKRLLLSWSKLLNLPELANFVQTKPGQLEMVRILTDGLPRTLQFFVNILLTRSGETGYEYMRLIMDQVTPLYQERLNNLPPAQRKIVLQMAFLWEASGAKGLSEVTRMENRLVSAQLKQLIDKGIAEKIETGTKNHLYRLAERFFNLWLIFTQGSPKEKRRARYLTVFLENFYDEEEVKDLALAHLRAIKENKLDPDKVALLTKAFSQSRFITTSLRDALIETTLKVPGVYEGLKLELPPTTIEIVDMATDLMAKGDFDGAIKLIGEVDQDDSFKNYLLATIYDELGNMGKAETYFLKSVELGNPDAFALIRLAGINFIQKKYNAAEKYASLAITEGTKRGEAMHMLGFIYEAQGRLDLAEKYYLLSLDNDYLPAVRNLGALYAGQGKLDLAEQYFLMGGMKEDEGSLLMLANLYYGYNIKKNKADELIGKFNHRQFLKESLALTAMVKAWNGDFQELESLMLKLLGMNDDVITQKVLVELLIHYQKNLVLKLFCASEYGNKLKEHFLIVYYAVSILRDEESKISLKIPPEMKDAVSDLLKYIAERQALYYGNE